MVLKSFFNALSLFCLARCASQKGVEDSRVLRFASNPLARFLPFGEPDHLGLGHTALASLAFISHQLGSTEQAVVHFTIF
jgi:hypothetical protein